MTQTVTRVEDLFDSLDKEECVPERRVVVTGNNALEKILITFEQCLDHRVNHTTPYVKRLVQELDGELRAKEIYAFSSSFSVYENHPHFDQIAGLYLSALAMHAHVDDRTIRVSTKYLSDRGNFIRTIRLQGRPNRHRTLIVEGDVGSAGDYMNAGELIIEGNVRGTLGFYMEKGHIIVKGNVNPSRKFCFLGCGQTGGAISVMGDVRANEVGRSLNGGTIIVEGDMIVNALGLEMSKGTIDLRGELNSSVEIGEYSTGGNIYHKGKQIVRDGERV